MLSTESGLESQMELSGDCKNSVWGKILQENDKNIHRKQSILKQSLKA